MRIPEFESEQHLFNMLHRLYELPSLISYSKCNHFNEMLLVRTGQVLESYDRAYSNMVRVQQLSELEEVLFSALPAFLISPCPALVSIKSPSTRSCFYIALKDFLHPMSRLWSTSRSTSRYSHQSLVLI